MSTPIPRPAWLKVTSLLAAVGAVVWPVLAILGLIGALPAQVVLNIGIATAALAYISIRKIRHDRTMALGVSGQGDPPDPPPDGAA